METLQINMINDIIASSLEKSMSYDQYRDLVNELTENNSTTGSEKTEALANYTALNNRRMKRWDKTVKVSDDTKATVQNSKKNLTWLVLTESWCGDAAHIIPVINKVAELNKNIDYRIVLRDKNEALMNEFLTNGGKSIPKLIMIDNDTKKVENTFGPRPSVATQLVNDYKARHGKLTPEFKEDLQRWYNKDKGQSVIEDLLKVLA
ncbi:thioredoxin family protein [Winogradskyella sp. PC-19]|uniref:thioredoxin family protein n=1 Tax=unclassified Winogradskyella TaxID=2615021 RepID=UPI000B3C5B25|nr:MULTISPECIES: thioredoxin family protein [unclassified Winogradskyella]ARV10003.1 thioredoxin family protein [Winogradskyella sp. PC-19]RZN83593.1 MAG: thioredoxin family protein [Winogradskyella sp.]